MTLKVTNNQYGQLS